MIRRNRIPLFLTSFLVGLCSVQVNAQCSNCGAQYPAGTQSTTSNSFVTVSTCMWGGDYAVFDVVSGETYEWTTCSENSFDTQLTLWDGGSGCVGSSVAYNDDDCGVQSTISWTATFTGTVTVLLSEYLCSSNSTCQTLEWRCVSCGSGNEHLIGDGDLNTCSDTVYDTGGPTGDYGNGESVVETYCSDNNDCIYAFFNEFDVESGYDELTIYNGNSTGAPVIGTFSGTSIQGDSIWSSSGCLTFEWSSDGSVSYPGWEAYLGCGGCPILLGDGDLDTCSGKAYDTGGDAMDYGTNESIVETYCSDQGDCITATFHSFETETDYDELSLYDGASTGAPLIGTFSGNGLDGVTVNSTNGCLTFEWNSDGSVTDPGWEVGFSCGACGTSNNCSHSVTSIAYDPDPFASGTQLVFPDDEHSSVVDIPFEFCFRGSYYDQCVVSSNAYISFETDEAGTYSPWDTEPIPNAMAETYNAIMGPWIDIDPSVGGTIYHNTYGTAPNRRFVVSYHDVPMYDCNSEIFTGQIVLYEGTHEIETHIEERPSCPTWNDDEAVHGLHGPAGLNADVVGGRNNTAWLASNDAHRFVPEVCCVDALPVDLLSFEGECRNGELELNWRTGSELENDKFMVERSRDGESYQKLAELDGSGNSNTANDYSWTDPEPLGGTAYYRLKQVDLDGEEEVYGPIAVESCEGKDPRVRILRNGSPRPLVKVLPGPKAYGIALHDPRGKLIHRYEVPPEEGRTLELPSGLSPGVYFLHSDRESEVGMQKLFVGK